MNSYNNNSERKATIIGVTVTVALHVIVGVLGYFKGINYLYPPPPEQELIISFEEWNEPKIQQKMGAQPRAIQPQKQIELVKAAKAQEEGVKQNEAPEATVDPVGDVEVPEPPREKEINKKALFHAANNKTEKDTLAPQTAYEKSDKLESGHASGNTDSGREIGTPSAKLAGRKPVNGYLPKPAYNSQNSGIVVVNIKVDNYGKVTSATVSTEGTTVTDKSLWQAAINAAKSTQFTQSASAPPTQEGTITYIFKITK